MAEQDIERRRNRRANCSASQLLIRLEKLPKSHAFREMPARNVSLQGVYFETTDPAAFPLNDTVVASVSISSSDTKRFPFKRLAGRGRIVRVTPPPTSGSPTGVAVEFGRDVTALGTIPEHS